MFKLVLKNGRVVVGNIILRKDVLVENDKIVELVDNYKGEGDIIDIQGKFVLPGMIDVHVHLREPGNTEKEDFESGSKAAAAGGVTTVLDMPNNKPPIVTANDFVQKEKLAEGRFFVNYGFYFGATKDNWSELKKVKRAVGIKVFMGSSTGNMLVDEIDILEKIFQLKKIIFVHAEDEGIIKSNIEKYKNVEGPEKHGLIRSEEAAYEATKKALHLAKKYGTRLHIGHVSTAKELNEIKKFKTDKITCGVTPHHLFLTEKDYFEQGHFVKMNPPLRKEEDRLALWEGIKDGTVDLIETDHAPHLTTEKKKKYEEAPSGVPGLETMLPLLLNEVNEGKLNLTDVVKLGAENPAKLFKIKNKGKIKAGYSADLVIVDMDWEKEVLVENLYTKCGWSPFANRKLKGWPVMTMVNGKIIMKEGKIVGRSTGKEI